MAGGNGYGRIGRFLIGTGVIASILAGRIQPHDKLELLIWLGLSAAMIDIRIFKEWSDALIRAIVAILRK